MTLVEMEERGVVCVAAVDGSLTPPAVRVQIDGEDRTDLFTASEQSPVVNGTAGFQTFSSEMRLSYVTMKPEAKFNGKTLKCVAVQPGFPDVMTTTVLVVRCKSKNYQSGMLTIWTTHNSALIVICDIFILHTFNANNYCTCGTVSS